MLVLLCSVSSYVFLNYVGNANSLVPSTTEQVAGNPEDKQEAILPDMAVAKKLIDVSKFLSSFVH
jgi:hypothetical protein